MNSDEYDRLFLLFENYVKVTYSDFSRLDRIDGLDEETEMVYGSSNDILLPTGRRISETYRMPLALSREVSNPKDMEEIKTATVQWELSMQLKSQSEYEMDEYQQYLKLHKNTAMYLPDCRE